MLEITKAIYRVEFPFVPNVVALESRIHVKKSVKICLYFIGTSVCLMYNKI